jgi:hypothetical protein
LWPNTIVEVKTTNSHNFDRTRLESHIVRSGWHAKIGHYIMGAKQHGFPISKAILIVCESEPPFDCVAIRLKRELVELGMRQCREALDLIAACERTGEWPGIGGSDGELELGIPAWVTE